MKEENSKNKTIRKGKQFSITRNFIGNLSAEDYVLLLAKAYAGKENNEKKYK